MFENIKNVRPIEVRKANGLLYSNTYELQDIPMEQWNAIAKRSRFMSTINSREVAEMVQKTHANLLKDIRQYIKYLGEVNFHFTEFFIESSYQSDQNKKLLCYEVTKMGCEMIANKLTGKKGVLFTATYVKRFNEMESNQSTNAAMQLETTTNKGIVVYGG